MATNNIREQKNDTEVYNAFRDYVDSADFRDAVQKEIDEAKQRHEDSVSINVHTSLDGDDCGWITIYFGSIFNWNKRISGEYFKSIFSLKSFDKFVDCLEDFMHQNRLSFRGHKNEFSEYTEEKMTKLTNGTLAHDEGFYFEIEYRIKLDEE